MLKKIILFFILILLNIFFTNANDIKIKSESEKKIKTINSLKNEIKTLQADKKYVNYSFNTFISQNNELKKLFIDDISKDNILLISNEINNFNVTKNNLQSKYNEKYFLKAKDELLNARKNLHKKIEKFILKDKITLYKEFVTKDLARIEKTFDISSNLNDKKDILDKKIKNIKGKILKNNLFLEKKRDKILEKKIRAKILIFLNSEKIKNISQERRKEIFKLVNKKIDIKIAILKKEEKKNEKKIKYYKIITNILNEI